MQHIMQLEAYRNQFRDKNKKQKIRAFRLPLLNFKAQNYYDLVEIRLRKVKGSRKEPMFPVFTIGKKKGELEWDPVERPPLFAGLTAGDVAAFVTTPFKSNIENHTQSVEHGVATTTQSVKRKRTDKTQLVCTLSTIDAREKMPDRVTQKRYKLSKSLQDEERLN